MLKLPSLADGDAVINAVTVKEGDKVVNDVGDVVTLAVGEKIRLLAAAPANVLLSMRAARCISSNFTWTLTPPRPAAT